MGARGFLRWAHEMGASTLDEAYDMLEQFESSNDVREVRGHDDTTFDVREELELGLRLIGSDAALASLLAHQAHGFADGDKGICLRARRRGSEGILLASSQMGALDARC